MIGWIKLHRKIMESDIWQGDEPFDHKSAWIDLLLMANHKDKKLMFGGQIITVKAGQKITSLVKLAERWGWSRNKVTRYLDGLQEMGMIDRKSDNKKTLINIVNYNIYQGDECENETADETANGQQMEQQTDTNKNNNNKIINNNNIIKSNKVTNNNKSIYGEYRHVKLSPDELQKLKDAYGEELVGQCITFLDEYIEMKGYKAKSHYLCIRKWVVDAVKEKQKKGAAVKKDTWDINRPADGYADFIKMMEDKNE